MQYSSMEEIVAALADRSRHQPPQKTAYTLDGMRLLMKAIGNPQNQLKVIHVAGTSGKTSTSYYLAALLNVANTKVGLTVSPHMMTINERVQINSQPLADDTFISYYNEFIKLVDLINYRPSYFELLMAFAYWVFVQERVDYAVIETGLGGLLDASNVVTAAGKVCVITDIGLDHTEVLGATIEQIARQKAGIISPVASVYCYRQSATIDAIMKTAAHDNRAELFFVKETAVLTGEQQERFLLLAPFQQRNFWLAYKVAKAVISEISPSVMKAALDLTIPGRMEVVPYRGKLVVLDGAHNHQKMAAFLTALKQRFGDRRLPYLVALKSTKDISTIDELLPMASKIIATEYSLMQDYPIKSLPSSDIAAYCQRLVQGQVEQYTDYKDALAAILSDASDVVVVTGSLYLVGMIRTELLQFEAQ